MTNEKYETPDRISTCGSGEWRRAIYTQLHSAIQSNERLLVQIGAFSFGLVTSMIAYQVANPEQVSGWSVFMLTIYYIAELGLCVVVALALRSLSNRIVSGFDRLVKLEEEIGVYDKNCHVPGVWFDEELKRGAKKPPVTFRIFFGALICAGVLSFILYMEAVFDVRDAIDVKAANASGFENYGIVLINTAGDAPNIDRDDKIERILAICDLAEIQNIQIGAKDSTVMVELRC